LTLKMVSWPASGVVCSGCPGALVAGFCSIVGIFLFSITSVQRAVDAPKAVNWLLWLGHQGNPPFWPALLDEPGHMQPPTQRGPSDCGLRGGAAVLGELNQFEHHSTIVQNRLRIM